MKGTEVSKQMSKIPWCVAALLCIVMFIPGAVTYMLTAYPETYKIGTFYGVVCIVFFAACGIYHRRKLNAIENRKPFDGLDHSGNRHRRSRRNHYS